MDYISQMEKLYKFFEFTLELSEIRIMYNVKHKFNDDLNLLGSFIKDFLTIKNNGIVSADEELYDDFVLWFETISNEKKKAIDELFEYAKYYYMIVFEEIEDDEVKCIVSSVNACFAIDAYPNLMVLFSKYYNHKVDTKEFHLMLECLLDIVLDRYENIEDNVLNYEEFQTRIEKSAELERAVV